MSDDDCPPLCEMETGGDSNGEEEEADEWEVAEEQNDPVRCLFCEQISPTMTTAIRHAKERHEFDLSEVRRRFHLDEYAYIKMINYIRLEKPDPSVFKSGTSVFWSDDKYLKPVENETWLMFDLDELDEILLNGNGNAGGGGGGAARENGNNIGETITLTTDQYRKLQGIINELTAQLREKENLLQHASSDIEKMKESFRNLLEQQSEQKMMASGGKKKAPEEKIAQIREELRHCVSTVAVEDDQGYFNTYSHFGIHHDMLSDYVRTASYRDAILENGEIFKGKTVMDLGCGTAILSMFAAKAGAKEVISVDQSDIIYQAMDIVRRNNIENIKFVKGRLEDCELPVEKVDIIVSEWMGYFLLFEGMMDSVIYARKQYLREGGFILPNRCNISLAGYGDIERHDEFIGFWKNVYGFDMSCMKKEVLREATVEVCKPEHVITNANIIANFDLMEVDVDCPNFSYSFELTVKKTCKLTGLVGYFDTFFELPQHVEFSTSPYTRPTHWKQTIFYVEEPIPVQEGQVIEGKFVCRRDPKDARSLFITIEYLGQVLKYTLN